MENGRRRERLRLLGISHRSLSDGARLVTVELEWGSVVFTGEAIGTGSMEGDLRASGEAAAAAAQAATGGKVSLSLLGIKAVRAFDGRVIIAAVEASTGDRPLKLLGAQALTEGAVPDAGVRTVLGAVNRVITPYLLERSPEAERGGAVGSTPD
jgi:hypothetical protein